MDGTSRADDFISYGSVERVVFNGVTVGEAEIHTKNEGLHFVNQNNHKDEEDLVDHSVIVKEEPFEEETITEEFSEQNSPIVKEEPNDEFKIEINEASESDGEWVSDGQTSQGLFHDAASEETDEGDSFSAVGESRSQETNELMCPICGDQFPVQSLLSAHIAQHQTQTLGKDFQSHHVCSLCCIVLPDQASLELHTTLTHIRPDAHVCTVCSSVFRDILTFRAHMMEAHALLQGGTDREQVKVKIRLEKKKLEEGGITPGQFHTCALCKQVFLSPEMLNAHSNLHAQENSATNHTTVTYHARNSTKRTTVLMSFSETPGNSINSQPVTIKEETLWDGPSGSSENQKVSSAAIKTSQKGQTNKCALCSKHFKSAPALFRHVRTHKDTNRLNAQSDCNPHELSIRKKPDSSASLQCTVCNKTLARRDSLQEHMRIHTGVKPYACKTCGATFHQRSQLRWHKEWHAQGVTCPVCARRFRGQHVLDRHMNAVHAQEGGVLEDGDFRCEQCATSFPVAPQLWLHMREKHGVIHDAEPQNVTSPAVHPCSQCEAHFPRKKDLQTHMRTEHSDFRPFLCTQCPWQFRTNDCLQRHLSTVHNDERTHKCPKCDKSFVGKLNLASHLVSHSSARPYKCKECDKTFKRPSTLNAHMAGVHNGKRHACPVCSKEFTQRAHIRLHMMRIHTREKPKQCKFCEKRFTTNWDVKVHTSKMHKDETPSSSKQPARSSKKRRSKPATVNKSDENLECQPTHQENV